MVKLRRGDLNVSQERLAELTGLGIATIRRMECGVVPSLKTLKKVAWALKMDLSELIR